MLGQIDDVVPQFAVDGIQLLSVREWKTFLQALKEFLAIFFGGIVDRSRRTRIAGQIVTLVGQLNEKYSAQHGKDLFKATNRTVQAQANLDRAINDFDDYKSFIDDLYFLFHESVGSRLAGRVPQSFQDINTGVAPVSWTPTPKVG